MSLHDLMTSDFPTGPDPPAPKAKPKPKAAAKPKAEAKSKAAPKAKAKTKSESSKKARDKTATAVESDPSTSSSMIVEPPSSDAVGAPDDKDTHDFPGIERLFEDYVPGVVEDPAPEAATALNIDAPTPEEPPEVPKSDDDRQKPPDRKDSDKRSRGEGELRKQAKSVHHLLMHMPKNPFCPTCED